MNILVISNPFPPDTAASATRAYERAVYWARWGHDVTVITATPNAPGNGRSATETIDGIRVVRVATVMAALLAGWAQARPQVVVATSPQRSAAICGWLLGLIRRVPFVLELDGPGATRPGRALRLMEKLELFLYRRAACVVAATDACKRNLVERGVPADAITVVADLAEDSAAAASTHSARIPASEMLQALELAAAGHGGKVGQRPTVGGECR